MPFHHYPNYPTLLYRQDKLSISPDIEIASGRRKLEMPLCYKAK